MVESGKVEKDLEEAERIAREKLPDWTIERK